MKNYIQQATRVRQRINDLSNSGEENRQQNLSKTYGSQSFIHCSYQIAQWMQEAGLEVRIDSIGNIRGKLLSADKEAKTLVIASHFDSDIYSGKYDGVLGIIMAINIIENLKTKNISIPFHIEVIALCEKEGVRFHVPYLGSNVIAGSFRNKWLDAKDARGVTLQKAMQILNYDFTQIRKDAIAAEDLLAYFEIHIEQGSILYDQNKPVGIVNNIAGQKTIEINFTGESGHAGAVPMDKRRDALAAAAKFMTSVEKLASKSKKSILVTTGRINVPIASDHVIPGRANCTLDLRTYDADLLSETYEEIYELCEKICYKRNIYFEWKLIKESDPVQCNKKMRKLLANAIEENKGEVIDLPSGASQDAVVISRIAPVSVLLIKCFHGVSYNSEENVELKDIATGLEVSDNFMMQLIHTVQEKGFIKNKV